MPGDDQDVAANALPARRFEPIGTTALDEFDELEASRRQVALERLLGSMNPEPVFRPV